MVASSSFSLSSLSPFWRCFIDFGYLTFVTAPNDSTYSRKGVFYEGVVREFAPDAPLMLCFQDLLDLYGIVFSSDARL